MLYTANLNLKKPELTDYVDIRILNENTDAIDTAIAGKVDVVAGKQLSTEDYTTVEKTKLTGIESGATADQTGSEIKTLYEGNTNTNAYTDAEKTKLGGIAAGAQVNAVTSVNTRTGAVVVTKTDVGLSAVLNYGIATQAEAEAGTSDIKYMTPLKTKQAVAAAPSMSTLNAATLVNLTVSGTWTKPASAKSVYIEMWGAGGGGGGGTVYIGTNYACGGGGGAGGGFNSYLFDASSLPSSISYIVGSGGNGGGDDVVGATGGNTSFYNLTAPGGVGGGKGEVSSSTVSSNPHTTTEVGFGLIGDRANSGGLGRSNTNGGVANRSLRAGSGGGGAGGYNSGVYTLGGAGTTSILFSTISAVGAKADGQAPNNNFSVGGSGGGGDGNATSGSAVLFGGDGGIGSGGGGGGTVRAGSSSGIVPGSGGRGGNGIIRLWYW